MTGLAARGFSLRTVRIGIDTTVLTAGWLLGGTVGIGTLASSLTMGPLVHVLLPRFAGWIDETPTDLPRGKVGPSRPIPATCC